MDRSIRRCTGASPKAGFAEMAGVGLRSAHEGLLVNGSRTPPVANGARSMGEALRRDQRHSGSAGKGDAMPWVQQIFFKVRSLVWS